MSNTLSKNNIKHINNFLFVDNIRVISMLWIVLLHVVIIFFDFDKSKYSYPNNFIIYFLSIVQIGRFGNICFFIISGFLFAINKGDKKKYVNKRWQTLKKPLLLFSILCSLHVLTTKVLSFFVLQKQLKLSFMIIEMIDSFFFGWTWFIYSLLVMLFILYRVTIYELKYFILSNLLIYVGFIIMLYSNLIPFSYQTKMIIGFMPMVGLGYVLGSNLHIFNFLIEKIENNKIIAILIWIVLYIISAKECIWFYRNTEINPFYNLKPLNQIYSIYSFFLLCVFCNKKINIPFLNPRKDTVAIYFIHFVVIVFYKYIIYAFGFFSYDIKDVLKEDLTILCILLLVTYILVVITTLKIIKIVVKTRYSPFIGIQ